MTSLEWTEEMQMAFELLKSELMSPPVLVYTELNEPLVVKIDASSLSLGAILAEKKEYGKIHPVQYASRTMTESENRYATWERQALGNMFALKKFRVYILSSIKFKPLTNHEALKHAFRKKDVHGMLGK